MCANLSTDGRRQARADAAHAEGLGDSRAYARVDLRGVQEGRPARQEEALDLPFSGGFDHVAEHRVAVLAAVVAPRPLVQVALQPLVRDGVLRAPGHFPSRWKPLLDEFCLWDGLKGRRGALQWAAIRKDGK